MKDRIRILEINDSSFEFEEQTKILTGVLYRVTEFIEQVRFNEF